MHAAKPARVAQHQANAWRRLCGAYAQSLDLPFDMAVRGFDALMAGSLHLKLAAHSQLNHKHTPVMRLKRELLSVPVKASDCCVVQEIARLNPRLSSAVLITTLRTTSPARAQVVRPDALHNNAGTQEMRRHSPANDLNFRQFRHASNYTERVVLLTIPHIVAGLLCVAQTPPVQRPMKTPDFLENPPDLHGEVSRHAQRPPLWAIEADGSARALGENANEGWERVVVAMAQPQNGTRPQTQGAAEPGVLILKDGQRIAGRLSETQDGAEWRNELLPARALKPDNIRVLVISGQALPGPDSGAADKDRVTLGTGETLTGRVRGFGSTDIGFQEEAKPVRRVRWDEIRSIVFAGKDAPVAGQRVWLTDGSLLACERTSWNEAGEFELTIRKDQPTLKIPREAVQGFARSTSGVHALGQSGAPTVTGAGGRYSTTAPHSLGGDWTLGAAPLEIEGPATVRVPVPNAPGVLTMTVALAPDARTTGVVEVVVRNAGREIHRARLDAKATSSAVRAAITGDAIEVELCDPDGSWVGDVVRLERAFVLKRDPAAA